MTAMIVAGLLALLIGIVLAIHLKEKSAVFGIFLGLILIIFSALTLAQGITYKTGEVSSFNQTAQEVITNNTYTNTKVASTELNNFIGLGFLLMGVYMLYSNGMNVYKKRSGKSA